MGGTNGRSNIVLLSARKHFLVHWLLTKFTSGDDLRAMLWAFACMSRNPSGKRMLASWQYARARASYRAAALGRPSNFKGRSWSPEQRLQMSIVRKGKKLSATHKAKISKGLLQSEKKPGPAPGTPRNLSSEILAAYAERMRGNKFRLGSTPSEETRVKLSTAMRGNKNKQGYKDPVEILRKKQLAQLDRPTWGASGLKGVGKIGDGRWVSRIRRKHLGVFKCPAAAHFAYLIAADKVRKDESFDR